MREHRTRYAAVVAAVATLITAVEAEQAARVALPPDAVALPVLPDVLHEIADPFAEVGDWLARLEGEGHWRRGVGLIEADPSVPPLKGKDDHHGADEVRRHPDHRFAQR